MPLFASDQTEHADFIIYADESGDHSIRVIANEYPVFVLVFCLFSVRDYIEIVCPAIQSLKFKFWGHDGIVLHEHDLRKPHGDFSWMMAQDKRAEFYEDLNTIIETMPCRMIAVVVDKRLITTKYGPEVHPYHLSLQRGMLELQRTLSAHEQKKRHTNVIFESRGRTEDTQLMQEFLRVRDEMRVNSGSLPTQFNLTMRLAPKSMNLIGLQISDLIARPVGLMHLRPNQMNRSYHVLHNRLSLPDSNDLNRWRIITVP